MQYGGGGRRFMKLFHKIPLFLGKASLSFASLFPHVRWYLFATVTISFNIPKEELCCKIENLDPTKDGEASEESHRATNQTQLSHQGHLEFQNERDSF